MKLRRSKILYLSILIGLIALALIDIKRQSQNTINYSIEQVNLPAQFAANPINNQNITEDEQDHFYTLLVPCD